jgi:plastocyanin
MLLTALSPARAATTWTISLTANTFAPSLRDNLVAGDTVQWNWLDGAHNVTAYQNGVFSSGDHTPTFQFSTVYNGGVVKYRCTNHSSLSGAQCAGMCGILTDRPLDVTPPEVVIDTQKPQFQGLPAIEAPAPVAGPTGIGFPVTVAGRATDNVAVFAVLVRIYDVRANGVTPGGGAREYLATCSGCDTPSASWSLNLILLPGPYTAEAVAADSSGNVPRTAPRVAFIVA